MYLPNVASIKCFFSGISVVMKSDVSVFCYILVKKKKSSPDLTWLTSKEMRAVAMNQRTYLFVCTRLGHRFGRVFIFTQLLHTGIFLQIIKQL